MRPRHKVLWCDCETSGLDPHKHDIIQFAFLIEIDGVVVHEENFMIRPYDFDNIDTAALRANRITIEELEKIDFTLNDAVNRLKEVWSIYIDKFDPSDKFVMAGYSVNFDQDFLYELFKKAGDRYGLGSWVCWPTRDVKTYVADVAIPMGMRFKNFKLETVCERFGIQFDAHNAIEDIRATKKLYEKLMELRAASGD